MLEYCTFYFKNAIKRLLQAEASSKMLKYTTTEEKKKQLFFCPNLSPLMPGAAKLYV